MLKIYRAIFQCEITGTVYRVPVMANSRHNAREKAVNYPYAQNGMLFLRIE